MFRNLNDGVVLVLLRNWSIIGPHCLYESMVNGSKIMLFVRRSPITLSPMIVIGDDSSSSVLSLRVNFLCSKLCRCELARAVTYVTSTDLEEGI